MLGVTDNVTRILKTKYVMSRIVIIVNNWLCICKTQIRLSRKETVRKGVYSRKIVIFMCQLKDQRRKEPINIIVGSPSLLASLCPICYRFFI